jgi:SAM-dependent methyltransferase
MPDLFDHETIGLLLLINRLRERERPLGRQAITALAEIKLPRVAREYDALVQALLGQNLIEGDAESFSLTPDGAKVVQEVSRQHSLHARFYNEYYEAVQHSRAHALFCQRAYGMDLHQHGAADMEQIRALLSELRLTPGMTALDFGCGDGCITEFISDTTGAAVTGVDVACRAIELAHLRTEGKQGRLSFFCADIEKEDSTFPPDPFDRIIAIDSIFFVRDQHAALQVLLSRLEPGGRMALFYHCPGSMHAGETDLAKARHTTCWISPRRTGNTGRGRSRHSWSLSLCFAKRETSSSSRTGWPSAMDWSPSTATCTSS